MTDTVTEPSPAPADDTWTQQLAALKVRYKHVREPVLVALNILLHDANVDLDDAKTRAQMHGVRITAAFKGRDTSDGRRWFVADDCAAIACSSQ